MAWDNNIAYKRYVYVKDKDVQLHFNNLWIDLPEQNLKEQVELLCNGYYIHDNN